jgi:hypothetical protein
MSNRRGMLLAEETLKILVAIISISFLVYFLTSLYFAKIGEQEKKQAEATMGRIISVINNQESKSEIVSDITPAGWVLFGFVGEEKKPNSCAGENCLCFCDSVINLPFVERQLGECDEKGVCNRVQKLKDFENIEIKPSPFILEIKKDSEANGVVIRVK